MTTNAIVEFVKNFTISKILVWAATILHKRVTCGTSSTYTFEWVYFITILDLFLIIKALICFFIIEISILAFCTIWLGIIKTITQKDRVIFYFHTIPLRSRFITHLTILTFVIFFIYKAVVDICYFGETAYIVLCIM